jgi:hypothetical protein
MLACSTVSAHGQVDPGVIDRASRLPGTEEVRALREAYPERVTEIDIDRGQWRIRIDDDWFYWADGRLLTEDFLSDWERYSGFRFYNYETGPLEVREITPELEERLRDITDRRRENPSVRNPGFTDALYGVSSAAEADRVMVEVSFLGLRTRVHPMIVEPLKRVNAAVRNTARENPEVRSFIRSLAQASAFHWRAIAGTASRSYHSYGVAIDLIPRNWNGRYGYWMWAEQAGIEEWWSLPIEQRWVVPQPVLDAFEANGFIWGGKWLFYDPIHFEYRPEVFVMIGEL